MLRNLSPRDLSSGRFLGKQPRQLCQGCTVMAPGPQAELCSDNHLRSSQIGLGAVTKPVWRLSCLPHSKGSLCASRQSDLQGLHGPGDYSQ